jgi:DoxX-like family
MEQKMENQVQSASDRGRTYWLGWAMSGFIAAFLLMDSTMKLLALPIVIETSGPLGFPGAGMARGLGAVLLMCTLLYLAPRTAVLGAILLTGYLGGAVATHVRVGSPLLTHGLFGVYLGVILWGGLHLRDARLRALIPLRSIA